MSYSGPGLVLGILCVVTLLGFLGSRDLVQLPYPTHMVRVYLLLSF